MGHCHELAELYFSKIYSNIIPYTPSDLCSWGFQVKILSHVTMILDEMGFLDLRLDLFTTSTHNLWLHLIIAPSLIFTHHYSTHYDFSVSSVFTSRSLVTASNSGVLSASTLTLLLIAPTESSLHGLPFIALNNSFCYRRLTSKLVSVVTSQPRPHTRRCSLLYSNCFCGNMFVCKDVT
jgi:hypothetical protein